MWGCTPRAAPPRPATEAKRAVRAVCSGSYGVDMDDADFARIEHQLLANQRMHQQALERAWRPTATSIEALTLKVLGGWEILKSDVSWAYFHAAGPGGPPARKPDKLAPTIARAAQWYNVRWPHDQWAGACDRAGKVRHRLAHLLYVLEVDNEAPSPSRKLSFMRLGAPGAPRKVDKRPGELGFRDDVWSVQESQPDVLTEQELLDALGSIKWLVDCVFFLQRLGDQLNGENPWSDGHVLEQWDRNLLVWWFPEWGDIETATVTARQLRLTPLGR